MKMGLEMEMGLEMGWDGAEGENGIGAGDEAGNGDGAGDGDVTDCLHLNAVSETFVGGAKWGEGCVRRCGYFVSTSDSR